MNIKNEVLALSIDLACTSVFLDYEREQKKQDSIEQRINMFRAFAAVMGDNKLFDDHELQQKEDTSGAEVW